MLSSCEERSQPGVVSGYKGCSLDPSKITLYNRHGIMTCVMKCVMTCVMTYVITCVMKCVKKGVMTLYYDMCYDMYYDMYYGNGMCFSGFRTRVLILR